MVKVPVDVPKSMMEFCRSPDAKEKPYDICLRCPFIRVSCDGPNILAMDYPRWVEWVRDRIKTTGLTKASISESSGIPLSTVNSALSGTSYDIRTDTMRRITRVIIGGCWGQYPCHFAALLMEGEDLEATEDGSKIADLQAEIERLNTELRRVISKAEAQVQEVRREAQLKIDNLKEQVESWKQESRIRDKYLAEKNETINNLVNVLIKERNKE